MLLVYNNRGASFGSQPLLLSDLYSLNFPPQDFWSLYKWSEKPNSQGNSCISSHFNGLDLFALQSFSLPPSFHPSQHLLQKLFPKLKKNKNQGWSCQATGGVAAYSRATSPTHACKCTRRHAQQIAGWHSLHPHRKTICCCMTGRAWHVVSPRPILQTLWCTVSLRERR